MLELIFNTKESGVMLVKECNVRMRKKILRPSMLRISEINKKFEDKNEIFRLKFSLNQQK